MRGIRARWMALALLTALFIATTPAVAGTSFDFLFSMDRVTNDNQMFLNLAVGSSGYNRAVIEPVLPRIRYVEVDLPVILFVSRQCGRPVDAIVDLRAQGLSWSVIFSRVGVPVDTLFVGIDQDPGPPYGKAWGYWKKDRAAAHISDDDVRGLVQVQYGSRWAGVATYEMARGRSQGKSVVTVVAEKHGRPYKHGGSGKGSHGDHGKHGKHGD